MGAENKIIAIDLDASTGVNLDPHVADEQERAIADLLEENEFSTVGVELAGPFRINMLVKEQKLIIEITGLEDQRHEVMLSLKSFYRLMNDYKMVCDSYYKAVRESSVNKIEALDMGRRGLHDEGATLLQDNLDGKIECDFTTARRLFTLIYALFLPSLR